MDDDVAQFFARIGITTVLLPFLAPLIYVFFFPFMLWKAFALATVWNWFIPAIFGARGLTIGAAMAIVLVLAAIRPAPAPDDSPFHKKVAEMIAGPALTLMCGYFIKLLVAFGWLAL